MGPGADQRDTLAEEEKPKVAMLQSSEHSPFLQDIVE
jgi:hypothetical protein